MSQPTPYTRQYDFPDGPQTFADFGNGLENELNDVVTTISETLANLKLIQRDDGGIYNGIVGLDALSTGVLTFLGSNVSSWAVSSVNNGAWLTGTAYTVGKIVVQSTNTYLCVVAHTSGTFATDLAANKWVLLALGTPTPPDGSVTTAKLADVAVTTAKMALLAVDSTILAANAVTTAKIAANAVTTAKITDANVTLAKLASQTVGQVLGYTTAGAPTAIAAGTTRQVLEATTGAVAAFARHGGDLGRLIASGTLTASGGVAFDVSGGFPLYIIYMKGWTPSNDSISWLVTASADNGATYLASTNYCYHIQAVTDASSSYAAANSAGAASIPLITTQGNVAAESTDALLFIYHPDNATKFMNITGSIVARDASASGIKGGTLIGGLTSAHVITNIKIVPSAGTVSGEYYFWGEGEG